MDTNKFRRKFILKFLGLSAASWFSFFKLEKVLAFTGVRMSRAKKFNVNYLGLYTFGQNDKGTLGDGTEIDRSSPIRVGGVTSWKSISAAKNSTFVVTTWHSAAIRDDGTLWMWGAGMDRQLGTGTTTPMSSPVNIGSFTDWSQVSAGTDFTMGIRNGGWLYGWGQNVTYRQLGIGSSANVSTPLRIGSFTDWMYVNAGKSGVYGIRGTPALGGYLYFTGDDNKGESGITKGTVFSTPVQVGSVSDWAEVYPSTNNSVLALRKDGSLYGWGGNNNGMLGTGPTATSVLTPTIVAGGGTWKSATIHYEHALGIRTNGTLWAWGTNANGKLGLGDLVIRSTPVQVGSETIWSKVSAGSQYTLALKTDGTLWAWGLNTWGNLGVNNLTSYSSPVQVGSGITWKDISAGHHHSMAFRTQFP